MNPAEFTFIEYSFNPLHLCAADIRRHLESLGFVNRITHVNQKITLWSQNSAIILLRETGEVDFACVTGIGLNVDADTIHELSPDYDHDLDLHFVMDNNGMRVLLLCDAHCHSYSAPFGENYILEDKQQYAKETLLCFSGILMGATNRQQMDFYQSLGFKFIKSDDRFNTLICNSNRFTIVFDKMSEQRGAFALLTDSDDVFKTQTNFMINGLRVYEPCEKVDKFGEMNYRINAYKCYAYGSDTSYSIETMALSPIPDTNIIVRYKRQYIGIKQQALEFYYDQK